MHWKTGATLNRSHTYSIIWKKYQLINIAHDLIFIFRYSEFIFGKYLHFALRFTPLVSAYMAIIMCSDRVDGEACFILQSFILTPQQWAVRKGMTQTPQPHCTPRNRGEMNSIGKY